MLLSSKKLSASREERLTAKKEIGTLFILSNLLTHRIVSFVGLSFSEEWKHYCSPDSAVQPLGSWRNVLSGKSLLRHVLTDSQPELCKNSPELRCLLLR